MLCALPVVCALAVAPVDFDTEIVPVLTKAGCNAAACHGAAAGRGGFKLSLFGGDPARDYDEIRHALEGRRVNLVTPAASLIVLKPTEQLSHGGGQPLEFEGPGAELLTRWIEQGARRLPTHQLQRLELTPAQATLSVGEELQLHVVAHFEDGNSRDVTLTTVYAAADPAAVRVDEVGRVTALRRGQHVVALRFLDQVLTATIIVPLTDGEAPEFTSADANWIDEEIFQTLRALRLTPSPAADEATLVRRLTLHLTGRLPPPEAVGRYLRDDSPGKYTQLVDRLLDSPEFVDYWTYKLSKLLRIHPQASHTEASRAFRSWLRQQVAAGSGWDAMARELLLAEGDTHQYGPANFYLVAGDARAQAEYVSELFLGARLRCANCHNHPLDRWTQDDYHGLAAIFAKLERGQVVRLVERGHVIHPGTGEPATMRIPGARDLEVASDGRRDLAAWLTAENNPFFAQAMVNRIWKALMGRGLFEPTEDARSTNPPTHPKLLERLAADFVDHGYSLRHTIRSIVHSAAYRRSSTATAGNQVDDRFYSRALATPLEAEVLMDAIADVTGVPEPYPGQVRGTRAINLSEPVESRALDLLGRCSLRDSCEAAEGTSGSGLAAKLHLLNGPLLNDRLSSPEGRLQQLMKAGQDDLAIITEFYAHALARTPRPDEVDYWQEQFRRDASEREERLEDFVWSLLNSEEFLTNH